MKQTASLTHSEKADSLKPNKYLMLSLFAIPVVFYVSYISLYWY